MAHTNQPETPKSFLAKPGPNETPEEFTARLMKLLKGAEGSEESPSPVQADAAAEKDESTPGT